MCCMDVLYVHCMRMYAYVCVYVCISGIYPSNFDVRLTAQKNSILVKFYFKGFWH